MASASPFGWGMRACFMVSLSTGVDGAKAFHERNGQFRQPRGVVTSVQYLKWGFFLRQTVSQNETTVLVRFQE
jgi:hypothetical protein